MNTPTLRCCLALFLCPLSLASAQESEDDEIVALSPFMVTAEADAGYVAGDSAARRPNVAITLRKPANAVVMQVALTSTTAKPATRNSELLSTIDALEKAVKAAPGLKFERRELQLRGLNRKAFASYLARNDTTSLASIAVVGELGPDSDVFDLIRRIRTVVSGVVPTGATKVVDGPVGLLLRDPDQYRREILAKVFEDVEFLKQKLGPDHEVSVTGLTGPVQTRAASEREVEIWIEYSFSIRSVREILNPPGANRR